jgi:hypothetical protein
MSSQFFEESEMKEGPVPDGPGHTVVLAVLLTRATSLRRQLLPYANIGSSKRHSATQTRQTPRDNMSKGQTNHGRELGDTRLHT